MTALQSMHSGHGDVVRANPKPAKRKRSSFKAAVAYADEMFSLYIRARDKKCVLCGSTNHLQCSHVFRRVRWMTRWTPQNAYALCSRCHTFHHRQDEHPFRNYVYKRIGQEEMDRLYYLSRQVAHWSADIIKGFGDEYKRRYEALA